MLQPSSTVNAGKELPYHLTASLQVFVFVSSTWLDLKRERKAVEEALQRLKTTKFVGMEYFGSRDESTREASLDEVAGAHLYLGIFADRYGSGITEDEYRAAYRSGLPCFIYFKREEYIEEQWGEKDAESLKKQRRLKDELLKTHTITDFGTPDELAAKVTADIHNWLFDKHIPTQLEAALREELPIDRAKVLLGSIRDLRLLSQSLLTRLRDKGYVTDVDSKLLTYVAELKKNPEFSEWNQQRYFELQLGNERRDFAIQMRLKSPLTGAVVQPKEKYTALEAIKELRRLVVIGEPGSGKTTALKHLAVSFADSFGETVGQGSQIITNPLPIYIWLPHFNSVSGATSYEQIVALVRDAFQKHKVLLDDEDLKILLQNFQLALLLDGLNEIGDNNIKQFLDGLETFTTNHEQHLIVITSRTYNFQFGRHNLPILELLELSYPEGVEEYIRCYLNSPSDVELLMRTLKKNLQLRQLTVNPLLLLLIILVFKFEHGELPNSRGGLFKRSACGLLGDWDFPAETGLRHTYWSEDKHLLLSRLGYVMKGEGLELKTERVIEIFNDALKEKPDWFSPTSTRRPRYFAPPNAQSGWPEFIDELERNHILFQTSNGQIVRFWHQTMQEYFAASYIWEELSPLFGASRYGTNSDHSTIKILKRRLNQYVEDPRWHEILAIVSGLISVEAEDTPQVSADQIVVRFIDVIWRRNKLLAAMCLSNVERFGNMNRLSSYVNHLQKNIYWWGIIFPRLLPWALLLCLLAIVWLIPQEVGILPINLLQDALGLPRPFVQASGIALVIIGGGLLAIIFFRVCASGILKFETFTNEHFIRPGISALRYIRNEAAERLLTTFNNRIANDFSVGETTRATIQTGLVLPVRDEAELILMLDNETTRLQAMERLAELGSEQGMRRIKELIGQIKLDDTSYGTAVRSLARITRLLPTQDPRRKELESTLKKVLGNGVNYSKRISAYRGLIELGITNIERPQRKRPLWALVMIACLIVALLFLLSFMRLRPGVPRQGPSSQSHPSVSPKPNAL